MIQDLIVEGTLRRRGVMIGRNVERAAMVDRAVSFVESSEDWELVDEYLFHRFWKEPNHLSGAFIGALRDQHAWADTLVAAIAYQDDCLRKDAKRDPGGYRRADCTVVTERPPIDLCNCADPANPVPFGKAGGHIADWFDPQERLPDLQGRWFCRSCGLEWVKTPMGTAGFREAAQRWGGAPDKSFGMLPPPEVPKATRKRVPKAKLAAMLAELGTEETT